MINFDHMVEAIKQTIADHAEELNIKFAGTNLEESDATEIAIIRNEQQQLLISIALSNHLSLLPIDNRIQNIESGQLKLVQYIKEVIEQQFQKVPQEIVQYQLLNDAQTIVYSQTLVVPVTISNSIAITIQPSKNLLLGNSDIFIDRR